MQEKHPGKKHIRIHCPHGHRFESWIEQNAGRVRSFAMQTIVDPRGHYLDVYYRPGEEATVIEEVLRYAGVISVCHSGSILD